MEDFTFHTGGSFLEHPHTLLLETLDGKPQLAALLHVHNGSVTPQNCVRSFGAGTEHPDGWRNAMGAELGELVDPREGLGELSRGWDTKSRGGDAPAGPLSLLKAKGCLTGAGSLLEPKLSQSLPSSPCFSITRGLSSFLRANPLLRLLGFEFTATGGVEPPGQMVMC